MATLKESVGGKSLEIGLEDGTRTDIDDRILVINQVPDDFTAALNI